VEVAHRINGRVVVAHNAMFDTDFLQQEFKRCLQYTDDDLGDWTTLCTVNLCSAVDIPRKLDRACFALGLRYEKHSALGDCHATAQLLHALQAMATVPSCPAFSASMNGNTLTGSPWRRKPSHA
jgi:DNA polymerase-3 subunit epsilon